MKIANKKRSWPQMIFAIFLFFAIAIVCYFTLIPRLAHGGLRIDYAFYFLLAAAIGSVLYCGIRSKFEYDSDGETLTIKNRTNFEFWQKVAVDEFPKYKLVSFGILDFLVYRKLYITIMSKKNTKVILRYNISTLSKEQTINLKHSLDEILRANNENKTENIVNARTR